MPDKKTTRFYLFCLFTAFIVRLVDLNQSFWLDEAAQALESTRTFSEQFDIVGDFQPPLFHLVIHVISRLYTADWWLRLAAVIPGLVTIHYSYLIAKKHISNKVALLTTILGTLSAYHYYFSQELRPYSLSAMLGTMSFYYFLEFIRIKKNTFYWPYVITSSLSLYTTYLMPFLLLTQLIISLVWYQEKIKQFLKHLAFVGLTFLPWMPMFWQQLQAGMGLKAEYVGWSQAVSLPWFKSLPLTAIRFLIGMIRVDLNLPQITLFALLFGILGYLAIKHVNTKFDRIISYWLILPTLIAFIVSFFIPVLEPKRLLFCLPAFWIIVAILIDKIKPKTITFAILLGLYTIPLFNHFIDPSLKRENWKSSVQFINQNSDQNSVVLFAFPSPFAAYTWYADEGVRTISTKVLTVPNEIYLNEVIKEVLLYDQVFVYEYLMDLSDPNRLIFSWLEKNGFQKVVIRDFHGVGFIHVYLKTQPVASLYE